MTRQPTESDRNDVVVVGGGFVGMCCATFIQRSGRNVTVVDRLEPGDAGAASFGNAGSISWGSCIPIAVPGLLPKVPGWLFRRDGPLTIRWRHLPELAPWLWRFVRSGSESSVIQAAASLAMLHGPALELHRELATHAGVAHLVRECGYLHLYSKADADRLSQLEWRLRAEHGAKLILHDANALGERLPQLAKRYQQAVEICHQGFTANPAELLAAYARAFVADGGKIVRENVVGFSIRDSRVEGITTQSGTVLAKDVVIAAGPWSRTLVQQLGFDVPLNTERGYHVTVAESGINLQDTLMETDAKFMATPMEMGLRFAGTVELAAVDAPPDYRRADIILRTARRMFPTLNTESTTQWMGQRPSLPDGLPVIGPAPRHQNVFLAFGHAHTGVVGSPQTGRLIASLVAGEKLNVDLSGLSAMRF